jgi:hypothetical protein
VAGRVRGEPAWGPDDPSEAQKENRHDVVSFKATLRVFMGTIVVVDLFRCNPASPGWFMYEWDKTTTFLGLEALHCVMSARGISTRS